LVGSADRHPWPPLATALESQSDGQAPLL